jgi:hypothetical protein
MARIDKESRAYFLLAIIMARSVVFVAANKRSLIDMQHRPVRSMHRTATTDTAKERLPVAFDKFRGIQVTPRREKTKEKRCIGSNEDGEDQKVTNFGANLKVTHFRANRRVLFLHLWRLLMTFVWLKRQELPQPQPWFMPCGSRVTTLQLLIEAKSSFVSHRMATNLLPRYYARTATV